MPLPIGLGGLVGRRTASPLPWAPRPLYASGAVPDVPTPGFEPGTLRPISPSRGRYRAPLPIGSGGLNPPSPLRRPVRGHAWTGSHRLLPPFHQPPPGPTTRAGVRPAHHTHESVESSPAGPVRTRWGTARAYNPFRRLANEPVTHGRCSPRALPHDPCGHPGNAGRVVHGQSWCEGGHSVRRDPPWGGCAVVPPSLCCRERQIPQHPPCGVLGLAAPSLCCRERRIPRPCSAERAAPSLCCGGRQIPGLPGMATWRFDGRFGFLLIFSCA